MVCNLIIVTGWVGEGRGGHIESTLLLGYHPPRVALFAPDWEDAEHVWGMLSRDTGRGQPTWGNTLIDRSACALCSFCFPVSVDGILSELCDLYRLVHYFYMHLRPSTYGPHLYTQQRPLWL